MPLGSGTSDFVLHQPVLRATTERAIKPTANSEMMAGAEKSPLTTARIIQDRATNKTHRKDPSPNTIKAFIAETDVQQSCQFAIGKEHGPALRNVRNRGVKLARRIV
jgi:hypothetical protein